MALEIEFIKGDPKGRNVLLLTESKHHGRLRRQGTARTLTNLLSQPPSSRPRSLARPIHITTRRTLAPAANSNLSTYIVPCYTYFTPGSPSQFPANRTTATTCLASELKQMLTASPTLHDAAQHVLPPTNADTLPQLQRRVSAKNRQRTQARPIAFARD